MGRRPQGRPAGAMNLCQLEDAKAWQASESLCGGSPWNSIRGSLQGEKEGAPCVGRGLDVKSSNIPCPILVLWFWIGLSQLWKQGPQVLVLVPTCLLCPVPLWICKEGVRSSIAGLVCRAFFKDQWADTVPGLCRTNWAATCSCLYGPLSNCPEMCSSICSGWVCSFFSIVKMPQQKAGQNPKNPQLL